jgi:hypothetical protein
MREAFAGLKPITVEDWRKAFGKEGREKEEKKEEKIKEATLHPGDFLSMLMSYSDTEAGRRQLLEDILGPRGLIELGSKKHAEQYENRKEEYRREDNLANGKDPDEPFRWDSSRWERLKSIVGAITRVPFNSDFKREDKLTLWDRFEDRLITICNAPWGGPSVEPGPSLWKKLKDRITGTNRQEEYAINEDADIVKAMREANIEPATLIKTLIETLDKDERKIRVSSAENALDVSEYKLGQEMLIVSKVKKDGKDNSGFIGVVSGIDTEHNKVYITSLPGMKYTFNAKALKDNYKIEDVPYEQTLKYALDKAQQLRDEKVFTSNAKTVELSPVEHFSNKTVKLVAETINYAILSIGAEKTAPVVASVLSLGEENMEKLRENTTVQLEKWYGKITVKTQKEAERERENEKSQAKTQGLER